MWQPPTSVTALTRICTKRRWRHSTFMQDAQSYRTASVPLCTGTGETYRAPTQRASWVTCTHACLKCRFPTRTHTSQIPCGLLLLSMWKGKKWLFSLSGEMKCQASDQEGSPRKVCVLSGARIRAPLYPCSPQDTGHRLRKYAGIMENNARSLYMEPTSHRILKQATLNCLVSTVVYYHLHDDSSRGEKAALLKCWFWFYFRCYCEQDRCLL